jgi:two-component system sensor histidine kinase KdpD
MSTCQLSRAAGPQRDAGVGVIATVNIQHLESVADTVEQITQARVRERVPDWVVRRADQIEFVDASPGQLRHRLLQGEIYPAGQVSQALTHFFRADHLTVLRELALRFLADELEEEFVRYLARLGAHRAGIDVHIVALHEVGVGLGRR